MNILMVDDDAIGLEYYVHELQHSGFSVQTATSVAEALQRLDEQRPDLLIMDWVLPPGIGEHLYYNEGGAKLLRDVRQKFPDLPIIVLSNLTVPPREAREDPSIRFLDKIDFLPSELSQEIRRILK